jgi:hypothetical protein
MSGAETAENGTRGPEIKLYNENGVFQVILCEPSAKGATEEPAKCVKWGRGVLKQFPRHL